MILLPEKCGCKAIRAEYSGHLSPPGDSNGGPEHGTGAPGLERTNAWDGRLSEEVERWLSEGGRLVLAVGT